MIEGQYEHMRQHFALGGAAVAPDGLPEWPSTYVRLAASGFGDAGSTITGVPTPYAGVAFTVTCNGGAADGAPGVDEYRWYLSQRNDAPATQYLSIATAPMVAGDTYSGSVVVEHTAAAESAFGFTAATVTPDIIPLLFRHCHLYVQREADDAIQWVDLLRAMTTGYVY